MALVNGSDIGISTGAYAALPLAQALSRIAEIAPSAEVCSWGRHSLLDSENARAVNAGGLPFTVHGPLAHDGLAAALFEAPRGRRSHRRHLWAAAELGATLYVVHPDLDVARGRGAGWRRVWSARSRSSAPCRTSSA